MQVVSVANCSTKGLERGVCSKCYQVIEEITPVIADAHAWNDGEITTPANCTNDGVKTYTCQHNGEHTYTEDIPSLGGAHTCSEWTIKSYPDGNTLAQLQGNCSACLQTVTVDACELKVKNATVVGSNYVEGNTVDGVTTYYIPKGVEVELTANATPASKMFMGFVEGSETMTFMPDENGTVAFTPPTETTYAIESVNASTSIYAVYNDFNNALWSESKSDAESSLGNKIYSGINPLVVDGVRMRDNVAFAELDGLSGFNTCFKTGYNDSDYPHNAVSSVNTKDSAILVKIIIKTTRKKGV